MMMPYLFSLNDERAEGGGGDGRSFGIRVVGRVRNSSRRARCVRPPYRRANYSQEPPCTRLSATHSSHTQRIKKMPPKGARSGFKKSRQFNSTYKEPLPLVIETIDQQPSKHAFSFFKTNRPTSIISNPECVGILDLPSRSVWVVNAKDTRILWQRGFFGKGSLSRSEPSWLARRRNESQGPAKGSQYFFLKLRYNFFLIFVTILIALLLYRSDSRRSYCETTSRTCKIQER